MANKLQSFSVGGFDSVIYDFYFFQTFLKLELIEKKKKNYNYYISQPKQKLFRKASDFQAIKS